MNINKYRFFQVAIITIICNFYVEAEKRKAFSVPLPLITASFRDDVIEEVFVSFGDSHEGWAIAPGNDRYVKDDRKLRLDHTYLESVTQTRLLSNFEASLLNKVCESFSETLEIFERDLNSSKWERCLYLDYWMPVFIKNFYYLFSVARNSNDLLPNVICVADSLYDTSPNSTISDKRIDYWRKHPDHVLKLRIAVKELIFQIKIWQQKELANPQRDVLADHSKGFIQALELFTRLYFNLPSSSKPASKQ
ncbi:MAG: hypothetical protein GX267_14450 [Fibrobacter sp.]|jgi:hypothetical protein|nr:hypothetical protein [Fibrobacter sp.]